MNYRPDIDGLRAIAVLSVLLYHAGIGGFAGGYVGVDVFFVISGFLIIKKISKEISTNSFSIITFYERRVRRIFPALSMTVFSSLFIGWWLFDAQSFQLLLKSAITTNIFGSNIYYAQQAGYFDNSSALNPLLHMWSLSVEEQFYLFLPLLLILLHSLSKRRVASILGFMGLITLILSTYTLGENPTGAFYLAHLRAWELLTGGFIALSSFRINHRFKDGVSIIGILLILVSVLAYSESTPFPGLAALVPVLGSALFIFSGNNEDTVGGKLLSTKIFVFFGLISYSLYLWHWPVFVFARNYAIREISLIETIYLLLITIGLAFISWKYIEAPFRSETFLTRSQIFAFAGAFFLLSALAGLVVFVKPRLFPQLENALEEFNKPPSWDLEGSRWRDCEYENNMDEAELCQLGDTTEPPTFLVWGDSHAGAIGSGVDSSAKSAKLAGYLFSNPACPPLVGIENLNRTARRCSPGNENIIGFISDHPEINLVILVSRWTLYAEGTYYKYEKTIKENKTLIMVDEQGELNPESPNGVVVELGLKRTIDQLLRLGVNITIVSAIPEIGYYVPPAYQIAQRTGRDVNSIIAPTFKEYITRNVVANTAISDIAAASTRIQIADPSEALCNHQICNVVQDGLPLYIDDDHLSTIGSLLLAPIFDSSFDSIKSNG